MEVIARQDVITVKALFNLQTRLFSNVIQGISEDQRHVKISDETNHIGWLIGHVVSSRYMVANLLGLELKEPCPNHFANGKGLKEGDYPAISEMIKGWVEMSEKLNDAFDNASDELLDAEPPMQTPIGLNSIIGLIAFFAHHESYTLGQIGIFRKFLGLEAMSYN